MSSVTGVLIGLGGTLLGAGIGALLTYFLDIRSERQRRREERQAKTRNLRLSFKLGLQTCLKSLNQIETTIVNQYFYPFRWMGVMEKNLAYLERLQETFNLLDDAKLQEDLGTLVTDLSLFVSDIRALENWWQAIHKKEPTDLNGEAIVDSKSNPEETKDKQIKDAEDKIKESRSLRFSELVDLKRRLEEAIKVVSSK